MTAVIASSSGHNGGANVEGDAQGQAPPDSSWCQNDSGVMKVRVELQAYLDQYSPNGQETFDYEVPDGARVKDLVVKLGMPEELASVIIVGETNANPSHALNEGDRVTLIPPLAGG